MNKAKNYRMFSGYTQRDMANILGVTVNTYRNKETGKTDFSATQINIFFNAVSKKIPGLSIDDIFFNQKVKQK